MSETAEPTTVARRVLVFGRVQRVGFRDWTVAEAARLGVGGSVRNLADGAVEAVVVGAPEPVAAMIARLRVGPAPARVDRLEIAELSADDAADVEVGRFDRRPTAAPDAAS